MKYLYYIIYKIFIDTKYEVLENITEIHELFSKYNAFRSSVVYRFKMPGYVCPMSVADICV